MDDHRFSKIDIRYGITIDGKAVAHLSLRIGTPQNVFHRLEQSSRNSLQLLSNLTHRGYLLNSRHVPKIKFNYKELSTPQADRYAFHLRAARGWGRSTNPVPSFALDLILKIRWPG